jgi:hypothetical protein
VGKAVGGSPEVFCSNEEEDTVLRSFLLFLLWRLLPHGFIPSPFCQHPLNRKISEPIIIFRFIVIHVTRDAVCCRAVLRHRFSRRRYGGTMTFLADFNAWEIDVSGDFTFRYVRMARSTL